MKITVIVKPHAGKSNVERIDDTTLKVFINAPAEKGKANKAVTKLLAEYFNTSQSRIIILSGLTSRKKIIQIIE